jgi:hypothetical protein
VPSEGRLRVKEDAAHATTCRLPPGTLFLVSVLGEPGDPSHLSALRACILEVEVILPDVLRHVSYVDTMSALDVALARGQFADAANPAAFEGALAIRCHVEDVEVFPERGKVHKDERSTSIYTANEGGVTLGKRRHLSGCRCVGRCW